MLTKAQQQDRRPDEKERHEQRIHFTFEDILNFRLLKTLGPATESVFALHVLRHNANDSFAGWRRHVRGAHRRRLPHFLNLAETLAVSPGLVSLRASAPDTVKAELNTEGMMPSRIRQLTVALREFQEAAIRPYWPRIHSYLESERESCGRLMFTGGLQQLFGALNRKMRWAPPVLTLPSEQSGDVRLTGSGITLAPSLFLSGPPRFFPGGKGVPPILVYPAQPNSLVTTALWDVPPPEQSLAALVGSTRSAVLQALTESRTTTELAHHVGISAGSASQHATVLRNTGLISTTRTRTSAIHTLTPLGMALFKGTWLQRTGAA
ncbi:MULTISPECIES: ArsR/SmtB family transcription factor [Streptomyces]|uniref:Transcriptional regulator n=1 Tax=Streptomyces cacaoi TaxID=1898 RepID=A0A4Y3R7L7_STRCI|nr:MULTISPECIES: winged helix-turn-helix domain-containing protein [Streptomyces]NNG83689.1 winged helix-turn-helix transcriptional regulator [Streptomyces cacaoi]GEB52743.1 transcriptional regulator [Streptomyces cacaoi]